MKKTNNIPVMLPEHAANPFIACLPPLMSLQDARAELSEDPSFNENEREYPHHLRRTCVLRLHRHFFRPLMRHVELETAVAHLLRDGYEGRNINDGSFLKHLQANHARVIQRDLLARASSASSTAAALALLGCSGMGKSETTRRILKRYPQIVEHVDPFSFQQVVWLKLECPHAGSARQLCLDFFQAMDAKIGSQYLRQYHKLNLDLLMTQMGSVATQHALGLLVIDEVQSLRRKNVNKRSDNGQESQKLLDFLLTLINKIGVPMLLVGTLAGTPLLTDSLRIARRASTLGSYIWETLSRKDGWDYFIEELWKFQWTHKPTRLTPELIDVLYEETQGILDLAVKLFMLAQLDVITLSEVNPVKHGSEELTPKLLKHVAKENFKLLEPMLGALKRNDRKGIAKYDDMRPFHDYIHEIVSKSLSSGLSAEVPYLRPNNSESAVEPPDVWQQVRVCLKGLGIAEDIIEKGIAENRGRAQSDNPVKLTAALLSRLQSTTAPEAPPPASIPKKRAATSRKAKPDLKDDDVRQIVRTGKKKKMTAHQALATASEISSVEKLYRIS